MKQVVWMVIVSTCLFGCANASYPVPDTALHQVDSSIASSHPLESLTPPTNTPIPSKPPTQTPVPTNTATLTASTTSTATETQTPTINTTPTALPSQVLLGPMHHQWQTLNNCHRASIAILMAYYDVWFTQDEYDLGMDNLAEFVSPYGLTARVYAVRYAEVASSHAVRWLLAEGIPVIMGQKLSAEDSTWHYRVVHGYNDSSQSFTIDDPLLGNINLLYDLFDKLARGEGQIISVYPIEKDELIVDTMSGWQMKLIEYP